MLSFYMAFKGKDENLGADLFACTGIFVTSEKEQELCTKVAALKQRYFKTDSVELRSEWFSNPQLRQEKYLSPLGLTDETFSQFTSELFALIGTLKIRCLGTVVDYSKLKDAYQSAFNPVTLAYELLLQRVANFLGQVFAFQPRLVCVDDGHQDGNRPGWKELLVRKHNGLKHGQSTLCTTWKTRRKMDYSRIPTSLTFQYSSTSTPLQIADLCAYYITEQAREFRAFDGNEMCPGYKSITPIMHRDPKTKKVSGFGAVLFPPVKNAPAKRKRIRKRVPGSSLIRTARSGPSDS